MIPLKLCEDFKCSETILFNANRCAIELTAGRRIGQLVFARMDAPAMRPYRGKYQGQRGATGSRVFLDSELLSESQENPAGTVCQS